MIILFLQSPDNVISLIPEDGFCFVHIPLVSVFKFPFLEQFSLDHLSQPFILNIIVPLHKFDYYYYYYYYYYYKRPR